MPQARTDWHSAFSSWITEDSSSFQDFLRWCDKSYGRFLCACIFLQVNVCACSPTDTKTWYWCIIRTCNARPTMHQNWSQRIPFVRIFLGAFLQTFLQHTDKPSPLKTSLLTYPHPSSVSWYNPSLLWKFSNDHLTVTHLKLYLLPWSARW